MILMIVTRYIYRYIYMTMIATYPMHRLLNLITLYATMCINWSQRQCSCIEVSHLQGQRRTETDLLLLLTHSQVHVYERNLVGFYTVKTVNYLANVFLVYWHKFS